MKLGNFVSVLLYLLVCGPLFAGQPGRGEFTRECGRIIAEGFGRPVPVVSVDWREGDDFAFSPDGKAVTSRSRNSFFLHDAATGVYQRKIGYGSDDPSFSFNQYDHSRDGRFIALSSERTGDVSVFDVETGKVAAKALAPDSIETKNSLVRFLPGARELVVVNSEGSVRLFDASGRLQQELSISQHASKGVQFAVSPDGYRMAVAVQAHDKNFLTAIFTRNNDGSYARTHLFETGKPKIVATQPGPTEDTFFRDFVSAIALTGSRGHEVLTVLWGNGGQAVGYDLSTRKMAFDTGLGSPGAPIPLSFSSDLSRFGRVSPDASPLSPLELFDTQTGSLKVAISTAVVRDTLAGSTIRVMPEVVDGGLSREGSSVFLLYPAGLARERFSLVTGAGTSTPHLTQPIKLPEGIEETAKFSPDGTRLLIKPRYGWPLILKVVP